MEKLQPNTNVSESNDSSERPIKQLQYEIVFLRDKLKNKNNLIRCVLDHLSLGDGIVCSNTEVASYRKSANDNILLTNEKKKKKHNKSSETHTYKEGLLNNNVLLHEESTESSPTTRVK